MNQVMGEDDAGQPRRIGEELPRTGSAPSPLPSQVPDDQLDGGMGPVEPVGVNRGQAEIVMKA